MSISTLKALILPVSPVLADAIDGPVASLALAALGKAVSNDDQASSDDIETALNAGGDDLRAKVRTAEEHFLGQVSAAGLSYAQLAAQDSAKRLDVYAQVEQQAALDRQDARRMQIATHDTTTRNLAYFVTAGFFVVLVLLIVYPQIMPSTNSDAKAVIQTLLGVLGTAWVSIISFYFGSSVGSKEKTALLGESVITNSRPNPPA